MEMEEPQYWEMLIRRSVSRFFVLAALYSKPMHGYELAKAVRETCGGCCDPSDAMIYPMIRDLLDGGYVECDVESTGGRERKVCSLTERGVAAYRAAASAWLQMLPYVSQAVEDAPLERVGGVHVQ